MKVSIKYNKLSDFKPVSECKNGDAFIISHNSAPRGEKYESYRIDYSSLSVQFLSNDVSNHEFKLTGDWIFSTAPLIEGYGADTELSAAMSKEMFKGMLFDNYILPLSIQLYGMNDQLKLPSYVGQVIVSETLSTQTLVKKMYGGTTWKQIKGRFLFGAGDNEANNSEEYGKMGSYEIGISKSMKMGGTNEVTLSKNNIPPHSHTFQEGKRECAYGKLPKRLISVPGNLTTEATYGVATNGSVQSSRYGAKEGTAEYHHKAQHRSPWHGFTHFDGRWHTHDSGEYADASQFSMAGELVEGQTYTKSANFKAKGDIEDSKNTNGTPHNNMPPYIGKYIWERTA